MLFESLSILCVCNNSRISFYTLILAFRFLHRSHFVLPIIYCIILAVLVLFVVGFLTSAMSGEGSFFLFIVALMIGALLSVFLRVLFINLSAERKFAKFRKKVFVISNKDLLHSL